MASTAPATEPSWTYERYYQLEDEERYEVLDGELLMVPAPDTRHQDAQRELGLRLGHFVAEHNAGKMFFSPTDVVLAENQVVQPDLVFIRAERVAQIVTARAVMGPPDLVVEILSPSSLQRDRHQKLELYARSGVPEFWIVDPANRSIEVLVLEEGKYTAFSVAAETGAVSSKVLHGFAVSVAEVMPAA